MTCFLIAALSADGYIGKDASHAAFWTSKEDKKRFVELTKRAGVVIMGKNTWQTIGKPLKDRLNIIYSHGKVEGIEGLEKVETTAKSPAELLRDLESRGFKEVAICGGSQIYTLFMKSGLVNTLYLTIEPIIFGNGMHLFNEEIECKLTLNAVNQSGGTLLLEYEVNY